MGEEIGTTAGKIWEALNNNGEWGLTKLKKRIGCTDLVFDWAIGWLAREDKIAIIRDKRSFRVRLKDTRASAAA